MSLAGKKNCEVIPAYLSLSRLTAALLGANYPTEYTPDDLEAAELDAYAEEYEAQQALDEFADIPAEILFADFDSDLHDETTMDTT